MKLKIIYISLIIFTFCISTYSQNFKVEVKVNENDKEFKTTVESYVNRELRSLGDVDVIEDGNFVIEIFTLQRNLSGNKVDYFFFGEISFPMVCGTITNKGEFIDPKICSNRIVGYTFVGKYDEINKMMRELITKFDSGVFEPIRKVRRNKK